MEFYAYHLMVRSNFNVILCHGRLLQQYIVDQYAKVEQGHVNYIYHNQRQLRAELHQELSDAVAAGDTDGASIGRRVVLPASFTGCPQNMHQLYQDSMAIVWRYSKPDLFLTFTCNPKWEEIQNALFPNQVATDRPDIIARVFNQKKKAFLHDIVFGQIFGKVLTYVCIVEFQKRRLPHLTCW